MSAPAGRRRQAQSDDDEDVPQVTHTTTRAKAPSAAAAPPSAHVDANNFASAPAAAPAATIASIKSVSAAKSAAASGESEAFSANYDSMLFDGLKKLMGAVTRIQVENARASREQAESAAEMDSQQQQRVERFLDVNGYSPTTPEAAGSSFQDGREENTEGYTYNTMLSRLFEALNRNHEGGSVSERNQVPVPVLEKIGKKKTVISNFGRICQAFGRPMEDVKDFIEKELSIRGNLDSNNALILKFESRKATDFDRVLIKYLDEYVKCNSCHKIDTTLTKDGRRMELRCNWCTATRTVTAAGSATFSAMVEKRSRQRAAMTL